MYFYLAMFLPFVVLSLRVCRFCPQPRQVPSQVDYEGLLHSLVETRVSSISAWRCYASAKTLRRKVGGLSLGPLFHEPSYYLHVWNSSSTVILKQLVA